MTSAVRTIVSLCTVLICISPALAFAADETGLNRGVVGLELDTLLPGAVFAPEPPDPATFTGVPLASRPLRSDEVLAYFRALAAVSPRAELIEYARSHEGRPLVFLAVSGAATIAELDAFKARHTALLDPRTGATPGERDKAVAWMAYGIHGDELSSTDAAAILAYRLIAGEDDEAQRLRSRLLVLIDPCENPDGRARYLAQTTAFAHRTANPDQDDLSHRAVWPWGRGNHYLFDLNRDWFSQVHPESRRSTEIAGWLPQLMVDSHEMGSNATYLFPPPRHPFNPHLPSNTRDWEIQFSDDQAGALDRRGYPYFSGEWNEEFFPGYGSSWAAYHGAVGILYEMSGTSGTLVRKRGGTLRTFAQAVEHQLTSSVANLTTLANHDAEILADQIAARRKAVSDGERGEVRAWIIPPDPRRPRRLDDFASHLTGQGIEVQALDETVTARKLRDARTGAVQDLELAPGTVLVRLDQPAGALVHVLLDPHVPMDSVFFRDEREYLEKGKGSRLYETTAWSLILGRGLTAYWSTAVPGGEWNAWQPAATPSPAVQLDEPWTSVIVDGDPDAAAPFLAELLQTGVTVRVAEKDFRAAGRDFPRGSLVIRREGNASDLTQLLSDAARRHEVDLHAVASYRAESGPDLGGSHVPVLVAPRVGVLTGMPVAPSSYGAVWHLLDQELDLRFNGLDVGRFAQTDLSRYNVLIFPSIYGGTAMYRQLLGPTGMERLRAWIQSGGTAIGIAGGARLLADAETALTGTRLRSQAVETHPSPVWSLDAVRAEAAGRPSAVGMRLPKAEGDDAKPAATDAGDPYDVAPILGPGARPFTAGHHQGTELAGPPVAMREWVKGTLPAGKDRPEPGDLQQADARLRRFMPRGAMLRVDLHDESWLTHGLDATMTVWFRGSEPLIVAPPATVAARFPAIERLHLGGLLWPEAAARIAGTAYAVREQLGRGQVILFAQEPTYRRWMAESERMFVNAVLMGPGLGTRWSAPW